MNDRDCQATAVGGIERILELKDERITELERELDLKIKLHQVTLDELAAENLARETAEAMVEHLESWRDGQGTFYDLTNPEAQVQPIIDARDKAETELAAVRRERDELAAALDEPKIIRCPDCGGTGRVDNHATEMVDCSFCQGQGQVIDANVNYRAILAKRDKLLVEALTSIRNHSGRYSTHPDPEYSQGLCDGHRRCAEISDAALAAHKERHGTIEVTLEGGERARPPAEIPTR